MNSPESPIESFQSSTDARTALNAFLTLSGDLFCIGWQDSHFSQFNGAWERNLGWTPSELRSRPWLEWVHPDDQEASLQAREQWERGEWVEFDHRFRHKDGSYRWLCWRVCQDEEGCIYALAKDITATKQLEKEQQEQERRFRAIFDRTFQFIGLLKPDGTLIEANQTALDFTGIQHSDIVNRPFWEARWWTISPQTQEQLRRAIARAAAGEFVRYEVDVLGVGDTVATIDFSLKPVWNEAGIVVLLIPEGRDVSERKRSEIALGESEERFRLAVDNFPYVFVIYDAQRRFQFVNAMGIRNSGLAESALLDRTDDEVFPPEITNAYLPFLQRAVETRTAQTQECTIIQPAIGEPLTLVVNYVPLLDENGEIYQILGITLDITERKRMEAALQQAYQQLRLHVDNSPLAVLEWDSESRLQSWSKQAEKIFGWTAEEVVGSTWDELQFIIHEADIEMVDSIKTRLLENRESHNISYNRNYTKDGSVLDCEWYNSVLKDEAGNVVSILSLCHDITERKQAEAQLQQTLAGLEMRVSDRTAALQWANEQLQVEISDRQRTEEALRQSEEQFRRVFEETPVGMALAFMNGDFFRVNQALCKMLGYTESELLSCSFVDITHPDELEAEMPYVGQIVRGEIDSYRREKRYVKKTGEILWANLTCMALRDDKGVVLYALGMIEDITERKQAEEALRQSEARYRAIVEDQTELICQFKLDGTLTFVNNAYCRYFGKHPSELLGRQFFPLIPEADREFVAQNFGSLSIDQPIVTYEHRIILPSGEVRWQQWTDRMLFDAEGNAIEYQAVGRDITKLKEAEAEIRRALEQERELSELRSGFVSLVSHEFRTPLTTIQSSAQMLDRYSQKLSQEKKQNHLIRIQSAATEMTQLLEDVLTIGKAEAGKLKFAPVLMDLVAFCGNLVETLQGSATPQHQILFSSFGDCAKAQMDEKLLGHILINLLTNAIKYSPQGGTIRFDLSCTSNSAIFRIQDNGIGIPPKDLEQLFESFHRASNVGAIRGTGLGLSIVKKCVETHRGQIAIASTVGVGTTLTVTLPLHYPSN